MVGVINTLWLLHNRFSNILCMLDNIKKFLSTEGVS
jgi:hypothetical protein